jgi:hypothetical protein
MNGPQWTDILQTVAVVAALLFTGWEIRSRSREQRFRNYLDAISGFLNLSTLMIEKTELHGLYDYSEEAMERTYQQMNPDERARIHYCDTLIALCETVWYAAEEKWLPKDEWRYWQRWTHDLYGSPYFRWTLKWVEGDYDEQFLATLRPKGLAIRRDLAPGLHAQ